ncbi:uncharacterized protein LOC111372525 [Olea europaea var. sylvestris]|uniref:uncharacterized protein LOC111372525 n=1 Tax=Olea europaea var. sylvestris TaxID=158386 RepID=UPI000C1D4901|nr:uncharacterized protein LOC111372525 [Olea europaea var. sylvestris]
MVSFNVNIYETERLRTIVEETTNFDIEGGLDCAATLNKEQQFAYDIIMEKVKLESNCAFFVDGPGETGKTFLYKAFLSSVRSQNLIALKIASSGVSTSLLPGGRTTHLIFKIHLETIGEISCSVSKQLALGTLLKISRLNIWDEAPMVNHSAVEAFAGDNNKLHCSSLLKNRARGKIDIAWGHCKEILEASNNGIKKKLVCLYRGKTFAGGGVNRVKQHLAGIKSDVDSCRKAPPDVIFKMKENLDIFAAKKRKTQEILDECNPRSSYYREQEEQMHRDLGDDD